MLLGTHYDLPETKYPFDESSEYVSNFSYWSGIVESGKLPCDLFSEVVIDCDDESFTIKISGISDNSILFDWSTNVRGEFNENPDSSKQATPFTLAGSFSLSLHDFNSNGRALYVSSHAIVRFETRLSLTAFNEVVSSNMSFHDGVGFDPRCYRVGERRLIAFLVHDNEVVSGDVVLEPGYNTTISESSEGGADPDGLLLEFSAGAGKGLAPCESKEADANVVGVIPDSRGNVQITSGDGCFSVLPLTKDHIYIYHHCDACCSCEGDYLPLAKAVLKLINRITGVYQTGPKSLLAINDRYNDLLTQYKAQATQNQNMALDTAYLSLTTTVSGFKIDIALYFVNHLGKSITVNELRAEFIGGGSNSTRTLDFDYHNGLYSDQSRHSYTETSRTLQYDTAVLINAAAMVPSAGLYIGSGKLLSLKSSISGTPDNMSIGWYLNRLTKVVVYVGYSVNDPEHPSSKVVKFEIIPTSTNRS